LDDLQRCEALGLELYSFRPGSTFKMSTESSITSMAESINWAHKATRTVTIVLKNTQGAKNVVGSKFSDLAGIIAKVKDKTRVGVSIDTFSAFAAGYDIRTKEGWDATMREFDKEIGLKYLRGMHLSDLRPGGFTSKKKDIHENIGLGPLGITTFQHILQDPRTQNIPLVVATPGFKQPKLIWGKEIEVLQALTSTPAIGSEEYLQSLVHEIRSTVKEAKLMKSESIRKRKRVVKSTELEDSDSVVGKSAESFQTRRRNEPELSEEPEWLEEPELPEEPKLPVKRESPRNRIRSMWQNYLL